MGKVFFIGPRTVSPLGKNMVIVNLGKTFRFLIGKKVMIHLIVLDQRRKRVIRDGEDLHS